MNHFPPYKADVFAGLQRGAYGVILADPPWAFATRSPKGQRKSAQRHYECQSLDWIKALPVADLAAPDAVLVMWATAPFMAHAMDVMAAWLGETVQDRCEVAFRHRLSAALGPRTIPVRNARSAEDPGPFHSQPDRRAGARALAQA